MYVLAIIHSLDHANIVGGCVEIIPNLLAIRFYHSESSTLTTKGITAIVHNTIRFVRPVRNAPLAYREVEAFYD